MSHNLKQLFRNWSPIKTRINSFSIIKRKLYIFSQLEEPVTQVATGYILYVRAALATIVCSLQK